MSIEWNIIFYTFTANELENLSFKDIAKLTEINKNYKNTHVSILLDTMTMGSYYITMTGNPYKDNGMNIKRLPKQNMSDPMTLSNFIEKTLAKATYRRTCLILAGHGSGWFLKTEKHTVMGIPDMMNALKKVGIFIDLLIFDTCMMSVLECMNELVGTVEYVVANQDYAENNGFVTKNLLSLFDNTKLNTKQIALNLAQGLFNGLDEKEATDVSVISINNVTRLLDYIDKHKIKYPKNNYFCIDSKYWHLQDLYSIVENSGLHDFNQFYELFNKVVIFYQQSYNKCNFYHHGLSCMVDAENDNTDFKKISKDMKYRINFIH
ncbi:clostripain precursor [Tupanvirus soda lake]|uniref:Clostripain n=2 Tax=Tupanvirus TaxID=2094720 RepID=A0A6N1NL89_9VIRU|nr:clostripain precursor [Tupanvirus soda lake]QKU35344.1 clostripain precursor [Tupanvirus soda lake]